MGAGLAAQAAQAGIGSPLAKEGLRVAAVSFPHIQPGSSEHVLHMSPPPDGAKPGVRPEESPESFTPGLQGGKGQTWDVLS